MAEYRYAGPHPVPDERGELVHPGDVREYAEEPAWGPWGLIEEAGRGTAGTQAGMEADTEAGAARATATAPAAAAYLTSTVTLTSPATPEGM